MYLINIATVSYTHLDEANDDRLSDEYLILENHLALGNFAGTPSISIPSGFSEGMPIAINLMGRLFEEQTVLNVAYALEQALGFENPVSYTHLDVYKRQH